MDEFEEDHVVALRGELQSHPGLKELAQSLQDTRRSVTALWQRANLTDYTDHSHEHSRRVAKRANEIATKLPLPKKVALGLMERYLLEMAAWVHDIGMQWEGEGGANKQRPDAVREDHALNSRKAVQGTILIVPGVEPKQIDLGVPVITRRAVLSAIGMLAHAHGTSSFTDASSEIRRELPEIYGHRVRGAVLAAILLMADELDLDSERVPESTQTMQMPAVSHAHWLKHECVENVSLTAVKSPKGQKLIHISIMMGSFTNLTDGDMTEIADWIRNKLVAQIALTEHALAFGTKNRLRFDNRISITIRKERVSANPRATSEVMAIIRADNARALLANHHHCVQECEAALTSGDALLLLGADRGQLYQGRDEVFALVCALQARSGMTVLAVEADDMRIELASDVLEYWARLRDIEVEALEHEFARRDALLGILIEAARAGEKVILAISRLHLIEEDARLWLINTAFPALTDGGNYQIFVSSAPSEGLGLLDSGWRTRDVGTADSEAVASHFRLSTRDALDDLVNFVPTYIQALEARKNVLGLPR